MILLGREESLNAWKVFEKKDKQKIWSNFLYGDVKIKISIYFVRIYVGNKLARKNIIVTKQYKKLPFIKLKC